MKSKYETHVRPRILEITAWARDGMIDKDIAAKLGIAYSTFNLYKGQHSEFSESLKKGKEIADIEVENALFKRAVGYTFAEEKKTERGGVVAERVTAVKEVPPDVGAIAFWLKNRKPGVWADRQDVDVTGGLVIKVELTDE